MEEKNKRKKKEMTINDLARTMAKGFEESRKVIDKGFEESRKVIDKRFEESGKLMEGKMDKKIEKLAILIQNEFLEFKSDFKSDIKRLEIDIKEVKSDTEDIKAELNKKVDRFTYNELEYRVEKLEKKFA